jgi:hybrid cluster-associated redox disulfide protein
MEDKMEKQVKGEKVLTADMPIGDVIGEYPDTVHVFLKHGLGCIGCALARFENIREGALAHGIDVDALMKELNQTAAKAQAS